MLSSPSIVPDPDDRDIYLVLDEFGGRIGRAWRETDEGRTDREIVITDLMTGQYSDPVRVVAFNTAQGWSRDATNDIADELAKWFPNGTERSRQLWKTTSSAIGRRCLSSFRCRSGAQLNADGILPRTAARAGRAGSHPPTDRAVRHYRSDRSRNARDCRAQLAASSLEAAAIVAKTYHHTRI